MKQMFTKGLLFTVGGIAALTAGCATPQGESAADKRSDVQQMRADVLRTFYERMPQMRAELARAPGYGVFSGFSTQTIIVSTGNGFGVIRDNTTGKDTYMRALKLGGGLGVGAQGVNAVVVFNDPKTMYDMINVGWSVTGKAEAAAKVGEVGDSGAVVITLPGMTIYRFTKNGVMLGGAVEGLKIWRDTDLN